MNNTVYTKEYCKQIALKYKTKKEFEIENKYLYNKIMAFKWGDYVFSHMDPQYAKKIRAEKIRLSKLGKKMNIIDKHHFRESHSSNSILLLDEDNNLIKKFFSATECAEFICGTANGIRNACKHHKKYKGYNVKYENEYSVKKYNYNKDRLCNAKTVQQYSLNGEFIAEYKTIKEAAENIGHKHSACRISKCCKGELKNCVGYIWKYKE